MSPDITINLAAIVAIVAVSVIFGIFVGFGFSLFVRLQSK